MSLFDNWVVRNGFLIREMYLIFFNYYPFENISIADIGLMFFLARHFRELGKLNTKDIWRVAILFFGFLIVGGLSYYKQYFLTSSFLTNSVRVIFYGLVFLILSSLVRRGHREMLQSIQRSLGVLFVAIVIELVLQGFGVFWSYYIPSLCQNTSTHSTFFRPSAFFDEPSYLSIYVVLAYFILSYAGISGYRWRFMAIACILLSQSLSGLVGLAWVVYRDNFLWARFRKARAIIVLPLVLGGVLASPVLWERLDRIIEGVDGSASHRLLGSLELTENILTQYPLAGLGLGQFKTWLSTEANNLEHHFFMASLDTGSGINNGFLLALGIAGISGLVAYLGFILTLSREIGFLILALWLGFSWGYILHPYMFVFYSIINGLTTIRAEDSFGLGKLLPTNSRR